MRCTVAELLEQRAGVVRQLVLLADRLDARRDLAVARARHVRVQVVLDLVAEVAADHVEERAPLDVGGAEELADVEPAARLVLDLLLAERVRLVGEVAAEDDHVGPDVADDVRREVRGQRRPERVARGLQRRGSPPPAHHGSARRRGRAQQREREVVLDDLAARLRGHALELARELLAWTSRACAAPPCRGRGTPPPTRRTPPAAGCRTAAAGRPGSTSGAGRSA